MTTGSFRRGLATVLTAVLGASATAQTTTPPRPLKVVIISMFEPEATPWIEPLKLTETVPVPGLLPASPALRCNADDVCLLLAGMGHANAAA